MPNGWNGKRINFMVTTITNTKQIGTVTIMIHGVHIMIAIMMIIGVLVIIIGLDTMQIMQTMELDIVDKSYIASINKNP